jgi:hypothetical protein
MNQSPEPRLHTSLLLLCCLVALPAAAGEVVLDWQPAPGAVGYKIHQGPAEGQYDTVTNVGEATESIVAGLADCTTHYFATTAHNEAGDSGYSNVVSSWPRPVIESADPSSAAPGAQLSVTIDGVNFSPGATLETSHPAIEVVSVEQVSCNRITAQLSVGAGADPGAVSLTMSHSNGVAGSAGGLFAIEESEPSDLVPPTILSASALASPPQIRLFFSEPIDQATATTVGNYSLEPVTAILSATLAPDLRTVTLGTSALVEEQVYTLSVENVADLASEPNSIEPGTEILVGPPATAVIETRIALAADDAEENEAGQVESGSGDLELGFEAANAKTVGMRFVQVEIPQGATITSAWVQFKADETNGDPAELLVESEAADDAAPFGPIASRDRAGEGVSWSPSTWDAVGGADERHRTPDLAELIQRVIDRPGWAQGNALVLIVTGSGTRTAESFDGDPGGAPMLHVEFVSEDGGLQPPPAPTGLQVF